MSARIRWLFSSSALNIQTLAVSFFKLNLRVTVDFSVIQKDETTGTQEWFVDFRYF